MNQDTETRENKLCIDLEISICEYIFYWREEGKNEAEIHKMLINAVNNSFAITSTAPDKAVEKRL